MIEFEQVTKRFPFGNYALEEVTFTIEDNEFVFLVGPSGAGKTTILKLILGYYYPTSGSLIVSDVNLTKKKVKGLEKIRQNIGVVFQDFKVLWDNNIGENVAVGLHILGKKQKEIREKVLESLELVGLKGKESLFPIQLSAGELQRVAIARALCGERKIILADEPTGNLDPKTTWDIMKIFKKIEGKRTIIIATHNSEVVNSLKKRVIVLKEGRLVKDMRKGGYDL